MEGLSNETRGEIRKELEETLLQIKGWKTQLLFLQNFHARKRVSRCVPRLRVPYIYSSSPPP